MKILKMPSTVYHLVRTGRLLISIFKRVYRKFPFFFTRILLILANAESFKRRETEGAIKQFYDGLMEFEPEVKHCAEAVGLRLLTDLRMFAERFSNSQVEPESGVSPR